MSEFEVVALLLVGVCAGVANTVIGGGGLLVFPALLGFGYSPVVANVTDTMGVLPGCLTAVWASAEELRDHGRRLVRLACASTLGALVGAPLLLVLDPAAFTAVAPALLLLASALILFQPWLARHLVRSSVAGDPAAAVMAAVFVAGVYGGYFGVAQGVILIAVLTVAIDDTLHRLNAVKNVLAAVVNTVAAVVFAASGPVAWGAAIAVAVGSALGGPIGARVGRRLAPNVYRSVIVTVGVMTAVKVAVF